VRRPSLPSALDSEGSAPIRKLGQPEADSAPPGVESSCYCSPPSLYWDNIRLLAPRSSALLCVGAATRFVVAPACSSLLPDGLGHVELLGALWNFFLTRVAILTDEESTNLVKSYINI
jgi:hypothetical protein